MTSAVEVVADVAKVGTGIFAKASSILSWLPWAIAGISLVSGAGGTLWYANKFHQCEASIAIDANLAHEKLRAQQELDSKFRQQLSAELAPIVNDLRSQSSAVQIALAKVPSNPACRDTPAARAFDGSVRPSAPDKAGPGPAGKTRP